MMLWMTNIFAARFLSFFIYLENYFWVLSYHFFVIIIIY